MRIATYNIICLEGWPYEEARPALGSPGGEVSIDLYTKVLTDLDCDVLALQELGSVDNMKRLATKLDRYLAPLPSATRFCGCVLSKYPVLETRLFNECGPRGKEALFSRFGGAALIQVADDRRMWIVNVHLNPHHESVRAEEAALLGAHLDALREVEPRVMVMGDFNSVPGEAIHRRLKERSFVNAMESFGGGIVPTDGRGRVAVDHIYVSPALASQVRSARVIDAPGYKMSGEDTWAYSDHLPVLVDLN